MRTPQGFTIDFMFYSTVPPFDPVKKYRHRGLKYQLIQTTGAHTDYLFGIFDSAANDCKVEIHFTSDANQFNEIREILVAIVTAKSIKRKETAARVLATKMYDATDLRNGNGLFVLMQGRKADRTRMVLVRFKAAEALHNQNNALEYLAQVFTKQSNHYKLAVYEDKISPKSFWKGFAIDGQVSGLSYKPFSYFWIEKVLQSQTAINSAQGSAQFSQIVKNVLNKTVSLAEQEQLVSAVVNLKSKRDAQISMKSFSDTYLSPEIALRLKEEVGNDDFYHSVFKVDQAIVSKELANTVLSLEEGITAYVPSYIYEKHVKEKETKGGKLVTIEGLLKQKAMQAGKQVRDGQA